MFKKTIPIILTIAILSAIAAFIIANKNYQAIEAKQSVNMTYHDKVYTSRKFFFDLGTQYAVVTILKSIGETGEVVITLPDSSLILVPKKVE